MLPSRENNHGITSDSITGHVGLDVRLDVAEYLREDLGERLRPPQLMIWTVVIKYLQCDTHIDGLDR